MRIPTLGRIVHYRGKYGYQAMRAAIVSCTIEELIPEGVELGDIHNLDSHMHVHLHVITPSAKGFLPEFNIPYMEPDENGQIEPGTWTWPKLV